MINHPFTQLLKKQVAADGTVWNINRISRAIYAGRGSVSAALNSKSESGRGKLTRDKLVRFFKANFVHWKEILECLEWSEEGSVLPPVPPETINQCCTANTLTGDYSTWNTRRLVNLEDNPWYVTGLAEGEGSFSYFRSDYLVYPKFSVRLRWDYSDLVDSLVAFFKCGTVYKCKACGPSQASSMFVIQNRNDLHQVIAHFEQFPLQSAKKRAAFVVWCQLVSARLKYSRASKHLVGDEMVQLARQLSALNTRARGELSQERGRAQ